MLKEKELNILTDEKEAVEVVNEDLNLNLKAKVKECSELTFDKNDLQMKLQTENKLKTAAIEQINPIKTQVKDLHGKFLFALF